MDTIACYDLSRGPFVRGGGHFYVFSQPQRCPLEMSTLGFPPVKGTFRSSFAFLLPPLCWALELTATKGTLMPIICCKGRSAPGISRSTAPFCVFCSQEGHFTATRRLMQTSAVFNEDLTGSHKSGVLTGEAVLCEGARIKLRGSVNTARHSMEEVTL